MATKIEKILEKHGISRYAFIKILDPLHTHHAENVWYGKLAGKRRLSDGDVQLIQKTLKNLRVKEDPGIINHSFYVV